MDVKKIIIVTNIPAPYRIPLFNELAAICAKKGDSLQLIFAARSYQRRKWNVKEADFRFNYTYLNSGQIHSSEKENTQFLYSGIISKIWKEKPSHVIVPGFSPATLKLILLSFLKRYKLIIWTGTVENPTHKDSFLKKSYRKALSKFVNHYIVYSRSTKKYLTDFGIKDEKITVSANTSDLDFFKTESENIPKKDSDKIHLTYVGYLSKRKNVGILLDLLVLVLKKYTNVVFDIVGDGEEMSVLRQKVHSLNLDEYVIFHGNQQKEKLPQFFRQTDIFLFQTDFDIWGLVLNEAMACALPCLASTCAIASRELIESGRNGYMVDFHEKEKVVEILLSLIEDEFERKKMGKLAQVSVFEKASIQKSALDFYSGIDHA